MVRRTLLLSILLLAVAAPSIAKVEGGLDVVELSGIIDDAKVDYVLHALDRAVDDDAQAVLIKLDSPGSVTIRTDELEEAFANSPVPVVVWVGDAPAEALGAAARLVAAAHLATAAPGTSIGHGDLERIGQDASRAAAFPGEPVIVTFDTPGLDRVDASLGQIAVWLNGQIVETTHGPAYLLTAQEVTDDEGNIRLQQTVDVRFVEPNLWVRLLDLSLNPATLFFFLAMGLTIVAFEFYAVGPGVAAGVALLPLVIAGYGLGHLPVTWYGLVLLLAAMGLLVVDYQSGAFRGRSAVGSVLLLASGHFLVDGSPVLGTSWGGITTTTIAVGLFFAVAMPVVARSRFSTGTFGRDHLIGRHGTAVAAFVEGTGVVDLGGARWQASAHRESGIAEGDDLVVAAVQGMWLAVEKPDLPGDTE